MMTIYRWDTGALREATEFSSSCWINLVEPSTTELESVLSFSSVPRDFLTDPLDAGERPRFDWEDDEIILIVHVPMVEPEAEDDGWTIPYLTVPRGSYAEQYCKDNDLKYTCPDANDWLNQ